MSASTAPNKIGLVGPNTASGVGYVVRDIATHMGVERWLVPFQPRSRTLSKHKIGCRVDYSRRPGHWHRESWFKGLDWVIFVERPQVSGLPRAAHESGVGVACVPMWEWLSPELAWLNDVDLMICPTHHTYLLMTDWKRRYHFCWNAVHVPWPVDTARFRFHQRQRCRRFVFVNGWGGARARRLDGSSTEYRRKGLQLIIEAAGMAPDLPFLVYSQHARLPEAPSNVEIRTPPTSNVRLYDHGDVCVQPSHWEGIGVQLLECQAAGMPLVTTDSPPMNEHQPLRTIPVVDREVVRLCRDQPILSQLMNAADLVHQLRLIHGSDISTASHASREFIVREHSWESAVCRILSALSVATSAPQSL